MVIGNIAEGKQTKVLKCTKCGAVYIFDSFSKHCPKCGGLLKEQTVLK